MVCFINVSCVRQSKYKFAEACHFGKMCDRHANIDHGVFVYELDEDGLYYKLQRTYGYVRCSISEGNRYFLKKFRWLELRNRDVLINLDDDDDDEVGEDL